MSATTSSLAELATRISGRVVTAADADWDAVRSGYNLAADLDPAAIVLAADADDVVAAVAHARTHGLHVAGQATGHNAAAHAGVSDTLVVDVRELRSIAIDVDARRARVGAGVRWRDVVPQLSDLGLAALHGSSPDVGIAGYSLGGGMGWLARKHGLQANSVVALDVVTADARLHRVDAQHQPDLFWALRGGNGNFGVVTAIEFAVYPAPELYAGGLFFPLERAEEVLATWTRIAPDLPEELMTWTTVYQFPDVPEVPDPLRGGAFAAFHAAFLGSEEEGAALVAPVRELGAALDTFAMVAPLALADMAMDPPDPLPYRSTTALLDALPAEGIGRLLEVVGEGSGSPLPLVQIRHLGGALSRTEPGAGARATMPGEFCLFALGVVPDYESAVEVASYLQRLDVAVAPWRIGPYPNFVEHPAEASTFFDAATWERLRSVKAQHDPTGLFRGNHRIEPATGDRVARAAEAV
jgi:FAD/FMN-containing dehydrogenase